MTGRNTTLRSKLLRWLLIPLVLLFLVDAVGSYFIAQRLSDRVYDGELMEVARELTLHVKPQGAIPMFDLEQDAEATITINDASGKQVQNIQTQLFKGMNIKKINMTSFAPGSYLLKVQTPSEIKTIPVVKTN